MTVCTRAMTAGMTTRSSRRPLFTPTLKDRTRKQRVHAGDVALVSVPTCAREQTCYQLLGSYSRLLLDFYGRYYLNQMDAGAAQVMTLAAFFKVVHRLLVESLALRALRTYVSRETSPVSWNVASQSIIVFTIGPHLAELSEGFRFLVDEVPCGPTEWDRECRPRWRDMEQAVTATQDASVDMCDIQLVKCNDV